MPRNLRQGRTRRAYTKGVPHQPCRLADSARIVKKIMALGPHVGAIPVETRSVSEGPWRGPFAREWRMLASFITRLGRPTWQVSLADASGYDLADASGYGLISTRKWRTACFGSLPRCLFSTTTSLSRPETGDSRPPLANSPWGSAWHPGNPPVGSCYCGRTGRQAARGT